MMKAIWTKPRADVEQFMANEYIAACGDSGKVYYFECNAPGGELYYYPTGDGEIDGIYTGKGKASHIGSYSPCKAKHEAESTNPFYDGFVDYDRDGKCDEGEEVIVWRGRWGWNGHATAELDMDAWETAKS